MRQQSQAVSVIIPAFEEESTIRSIITVAERHPLVDEVIVVDDGSTDGTADAARTTSAIVIERKENQGKGSAMNAGVRQAKGDVLVFLDADLTGFTASMLTSLIQPVRSGRYDMFTLIRDRYMEPIQSLSNKINIGGERALRRALWSAVPAEERRGFDVELSLNYYASTLGKKVGVLPVPGLDHIVKERKHGFVRGATERMGMLTSMTKTYVKLYLFRGTATVITDA
ncbi:MAG: glycosyltransferase family 2 protein [Candidatus Peribacteraceae bacterium]|jgi:glycosyltransferase involved in cell wall biosynthesis